MNKTFAIILIACSSLFAQLSYAVGAPIIVAAHSTQANQKQNNPVLSKQNYICWYQVPGYVKYINLYNMNSITSYDVGVYVQLIGNSYYISKTKTLSTEQIITSIFARLEQCKKGE